MTETLSEELKAVASARILRAARAVLAERGLDVTVDEIAEAAGVSRRTVFRHFTSHGQLLAAGVDALYDAFEAAVPGQPEDGADLDSWLSATAVALHRAHNDAVGQAFWEANAPRTSSPPEVRDVIAKRMEVRSRLATQVTTTAWHLAGGKGKPPRWVTDAFHLQLSGFATQGLRALDGDDPRAAEETGLVAAKILSSVLVAALAER